jgi:cell division protein FtsB
LITGAYDIITSSILALIGISAGTSLSAVVIDNNKGEELLSKTYALQEEEKELLQRINDIEAEIALNPNNKNELQVELASKKARLPHVSSEISKILFFLHLKRQKGL